MFGAFGEGAGVRQDNRGRLVVALGEVSVPDHLGCAGICRCYVFFEISPADTPVPAVIFSAVYGACFMRIDQSRPRFSVPPVQVSNDGSLNRSNAPLLVSWQGQLEY